MYNYKKKLKSKFSNFFLHSACTFKNILEHCELLTTTAVAPSSISKQFRVEKFRHPVRQRQWSRQQQQLVLRVKHVQKRPQQPQTKHVHFSFFFCQKGVILEELSWLPKRVLNRVLSKSSLWSVERWKKCLKSVNFNLFFY